MVKITTKTVKLGALKINPDNPRRISTKDMDRLVKSLQEFPDMMGINPRLIGFRTLAKNVGGIYAITGGQDGISQAINS